MTAVMESPAARDAVKANAAVSLVAQRLLDAQADLVEINGQLAELILWAEVDPEAGKPQLDAARARQRQVEQRVEDLRRAEVVARGLAVEAERRELEARKVADWQAACEAFDRAVATAEELDAALARVGEVYQRLQAEMRDAVMHCWAHLSEDQRVAASPGSLDDQVRVTLARVGGPSTDVGRSGRPATVMELVQWRSHNVMRHRPKIEKAADA